MPYSCSRDRLLNFWSICEEHLVFIFLARKNMCISPTWTFIALGSLKSFCSGTVIVKKKKTKLRCVNKWFKYKTKSNVVWRKTLRKLDYNTGTQVSWNFSFTPFILCSSYIWPANVDSVFHMRLMVLFIDYESERFPRMYGFVLCTYTFKIIPSTLVPSLRAVDRVSSVLYDNKEMFWR